MFLTLDDAAARLSIHPSTLRRRVSAGMVPGAVRLGGPRSPWRVPVSYVDGAGATHDTVPTSGSSTSGPLAHARPGTGPGPDYVTSARARADRVRSVSRALVVESRPAVGLRAALDGILDVRARHYAGRDGWCVACHWEYPCPDASILDDTVDRVAAAVLDGDRS